MYHTKCKLGYAHNHSFRIGRCDIIWTAGPFAEIEGHYSLHSPLHIFKMVLWSSTDRTLRVSRVCAQRDVA